MIFNNSKIWFIGITLIVLSAAAAFANGTVEDGDYGYYGRNGNMGMRGNRGMMDDWQDVETRTVEGKFSMVDGEYPAIITDSGETFYLMTRPLLDEDQLPREGADLKIEAVQSPMSPVHLMVLSGEADGAVLESDWNGPGEYGMMGGGYKSGGHGYGGQSMGDSYDCDMDDGIGRQGKNGAPRGWGASTADDDQ